MRMLLVEDNTELASLIVPALEAEGFVCDLVTHVADAETALRTVRYSVVALDLGLPDGSGLDVLRELRRRHDSTPVLILTARSAVHDRVRGLDSGADDYLVKPFDMTELVARLKALLRRPGHLLGQLLRVGNIKLDTEAKQVFVNEGPVTLSPREIALLELLMRRVGLVVRKKTIEDEYYGLAGEISSNAVEVQVSRLRKQLANVGASASIHTIHGLGYLIKEE